MKLYIIRNQCSQIEASSLSVTTKKKIIAKFNIYIKKVNCLDCELNKSDFFFLNNENGIL